MTAIALRNLCVSYGDTRVVEDVSLDIAEGECFGLVGESGSGKSTVLRAITGLASDWTGGISLFGKPRGKRIDRAFASLCQMVFQDPYGSLHPRQTVDATLSEPLAIHGIRGADRLVPEMMAACGLEPKFRFRLPHQLSGGQRQRVAIARALMLKPKMLLLDETSRCRPKSSTCSSACASSRASPTYSSPTTCRWSRSCAIGWLSCGRAASSRPPMSPSSGRTR